jgi:arylsulfatase A-like enzyme
MPLRIVLAAFAVGLALSAAECGSSGDGGAAAERYAAAADKPNLIVIQTDDQSLAETSPKTMPNTYRLLAGHGTNFKNYVVTTPDCCPSRASLFTGQYAHNHGVLSNRIGFPGLEDPGNVLPVWLQDAGYNTAHFGKFMNGYHLGDPPGSQPAPGWDYWWTYVGKERYYHYRTSINGAIKAYGERPRDYFGRVISRKATRYISKEFPNVGPSYMQIDVHAPHSSHSDPRHVCDPAAVPDPRDYAGIKHAVAPRSRAFNEHDVGDKPQFIRRQPRFGPHVKKEIDRSYGCAVASLRQVDRTVVDVVRAVRHAHELKNTVFVFTSDNGLLLGQHRLRDTKQYPYEESVRVPMMIRMPTRDTPPVERAPVANIDVAPTLLELADASPCAPGLGCRTLDGRSMVPALTGNGELPTHRHLVVEFSVPHAFTRRGTTCSWTGLWTPQTLFALHYRTVVNPDTGRCVESNDIEHYDLRHDPHELHNLASGNSQREARRKERLGKLLDKLRDCVGSEGSLAVQGPGTAACE